MKIAVYLDTDKLKDRLKARLKELKKTPRGASLEAGLGASTIRNILDGKSKSPRADTLLALAEVLDVDVYWFMESAVHPKDKEPGEKSKVDAEVLFDLNVIDDRFRADLKKQSAMDTIPLIIPILVDNVFLFERSKVFIQRPPELNDTNQAYGIIMRDTIMSPVYREHDILLVNPDLPIKISEDYLFYFRDVAEGYWKAATIGRLEYEQPDGTYVIRQFGGNPEYAYIPKSEFSFVHAIIGKQLRTE